MTEPYSAPTITRRVFVRPNAHKALYIVWDDVEFVFSHLSYVGAGLTDAILRTERVTRRARYSSTATVDDILGALVHIHANRPAGWLELGEQ